MARLVRAIQAVGNYGEVFARNIGEGTTINLARGLNAAKPVDGKAPFPSTAWHPAFEDVNNDGLVDLFVANDTQPNRLYENKRNGTFVDVGLAAGVLAVRAVAAVPLQAALKSE